MFFYIIVKIIMPSTTMSLDVRKMMSSFFKYISAGECVFPPSIVYECQ